MASSDQEDTRPVAVRAAPFGHRYLREWLLDPACTYLNHGTVGATPRRVLAAQQQLRSEIERNPARFLLRELSGPLAGGARTGESRMRSAAHEVAAFFHARGEDLVFTDNSTTAINAVLRSIDFHPGDEILLLDHAYGAIRKTAEYVARKTQAELRTAVLPFPSPEPEAVIRAVQAVLGPRTRIAIIDHVTASSALVLPLAEIAAVCKQRGVSVLADGAHAPGALPLDIPALGVDWYTGNLHKWAWAPRSCAILWVHPSRQAELHPTTISWGLDQGMCEEFDWVGTRDPTPYLTAPTALSWLRELGSANVARYNHELAWQAGQVLSASWGSACSVPESMVGTMICARLPEAAGASQEAADALRARLLFEHAIEVPLIALSGAIWARVSAQIYNELSDIERLAEAVRAHC